MRATCRDVSDFLLDYVSGELPRAQREIFETHLAACVHCRAYLRSYERTIALGRSLCARDDDPPPPDAPPSLVRAILAARARGAPQPS